MIPFLSSGNFQGKKVLLRLDLDLPTIGKGFDLSRLEDGIPTIQYLLDAGAQSITIIAHRGRPEGKKVSALEMKPVEALLRKKFSKEQNALLTIAENLRFDLGEEKNQIGFAKKLAKGHDIFVNDAFAVSHREHASIVSVPTILPTYLGLRFQKEIEKLSKVLVEPKRPVVFIFGGAKIETRLPLFETATAKADVILVGGKLIEEVKNHNISNRKLIVGTLTEDGLDIDENTINQFLRFVAMAKTIVWNGPLGKYEDAKHAAGTRAIAEAVDRSSAYTIVGGGDTEAALTKFGLEKKISFVSSGGGAMLVYLTTGTLPGIEAAMKSGK